MHQITGYYFFTKGEKQYVMYSTLYSHGRYASTHDCTGLTEEQARGKFILEHSAEVDHLLKQKAANDRQQNSRILLNN